MSIYQEIWDADQSGNGVQPILTSQAGNTATGYVKVVPQQTSTDPKAKILAEVVIPQHKKHSYDSVRALFDNYALDERAAEVETLEERAEVHELLEAVIDTPPDAGCPHVHLGRDRHDGLPRALVRDDHGTVVSPFLAGRRP